MYERQLRQAGHTRRYEIVERGGAWEARAVLDSQVVTHARYDDWHRVERAKAIHRLADLATTAHTGRCLTYDALRRFHGDLRYREEPDAGHWWDKQPAPGADCVPRSTTSSAPRSPTALSRFADAEEAPHWRWRPPSP